MRGRLDAVLWGQCEVSPDILKLNKNNKNKLQKALLNDSTSQSLKLSGLQVSALHMETRPSTRPVV